MNLAGHHHCDLLAAAGLQQQPALAERADVGGLGAQHVGERRAALDRHRHAVHEARQRLQAGAVPGGGEGGDERCAGAGLGQDLVELGDQRAGRQPGDPGPWRPSGPRRR